MQEIFLFEGEGYLELLVFKAIEGLCVVKYLVVAHGVEQTKSELELHTGLEPLVVNVETCAELNTSKAFDFNQLKSCPFFLNEKYNFGLPPANR